MLTNNANIDFCNLNQPLTKYILNIGRLENWNSLNKRKISTHD